MKLFYYPECPYCKKVLRFTEEHAISIELLNAREDVIAEQLVMIGGKLQVPALLIDDTVMYESNDIIAYLDSAN